MKKFLVIYDLMNGTIYDKREEPFSEPSDELAHLVLEVEEGFRVKGIDVSGEKAAGIFEEITSPLKGVKDQVEEVNKIALTALEIAATLYETLCSDS